jgi:hypothetical protein
VGSRKKTEQQTFADIRRDVEKSERRQTLEAGPSLVHEREWIDDVTGACWHKRGDLLELRDLRRLRKHPDLMVLHVDGPDEPREVDEAERDDLLDRVHDYFRAPDASAWDFLVAEFRDDDHRILLVVDESCR